jgi:hypothetical protein
MHFRYFAAAAALVAAPALAGPLSPNAGAFTGEGVLNDHDGNQGTWQASGALKGGDFTGTLAIVLGGKALTVTMQPGPAYMENGTCVLKGENGRSRFELRGKCDTAAFGPGTISGYFDGDRNFNGEFTGALHWGATGTNAAAKGAALPTARLTCAYMERVGGVVAGDIGTREIRPSALGTLTLSPGGSYVARNGAGKFVREGDTIRLTSGPWAGARGTLMADRSGEPAVYFELADNRRADGSYIVDPWRTSCTSKR